MIDKKTLKFLKQLSSNNSKEWLDENRSDYNFAKDDVLNMTQTLINMVAEFDLGIAKADLNPKKCITRLNRDLRFSKDKTPYKTDYYIVLNQNGKNSPSAFYYVHIQPNNCFVGGGVYNPQPAELKKIRNEINASFDDWNKIIHNKDFQTKFPCGIHNSGILVRSPRGFEDDNPAMEFLKMKGFYTQEPITDKELQSNRILAKIVDYFKSVKPLVDFINLAIEE
uniref:DUF2461 domain-containing protein n=1 Tax=Polaribacter sp. TaxID=1920175 RepID=UPI004047CDFF